MFIMKGERHPCQLRSTYPTGWKLLVAKNPNPNFTFDDLKGTEIIGGRKGGVPEMTLEYVLKSKGSMLIQIIQTPKLMFEQISLLMLWQVPLLGLMLNMLLYLNR